MKQIIKLFAILCISVAVFLLAYYVKCQADICFFKNFHLENYLPLQAFQFRKIIVLTKDSGEVLNDNFNYPRFFPKWSQIWMKETGGVIQKYDHNGINGSRCLLIENKGDQVWSYKQIQFVRVNHGDIFSYMGYAKISGKTKAFFSIILYDKERLVIKWDYALKEVSPAEEWLKVNDRFIVPAGVFYIRFHLTGEGKGLTWFDNIEFRKEGHNND